MNLTKIILLLVCRACLAFAAERSGQAVVPLPNAHAHNDYEHGRPLLDALDHGFGSVEADIYLVEGKLLVAHDLKDAKPERTLQALYLDPLHQRVKENRGRVYRDRSTLLLLVDVKSEAASTYAVLRNALKSYAEILTAFHADRIETNAVTVIISGNRNRDLMAAETIRYAAFDGRAADLEGKASVSLIPLVSDSWSTHFQWRGEGPFPEVEEQKLRRIVQQAHEQARKVRFWATPDRPEMWRVLLRVGVDLINADNLAGLRDFLMAEK